MPFKDNIRIAGGPDVSNYSETARITHVEFRRDNFMVRHTKEGTRADSWPAVHVPGWGNGRDDPGNIQWTLYIVIDNGGQWVTGPCILYWPEAAPSLGVDRGGPAPFSDAARNWYYQIGDMAGRQPTAGQRIGVLAVAGGWRGINVPSVAERSNVAWVTVPANDTGTFDFPQETDPPPTTDPDPPTTDPNPPTVDPGVLANAVAAILGKMFEFDQRAEARHQELLQAIHDADSSDTLSQARDILLRGFDLKLFGTTTHISPTPKK